MNKRLILAVSLCAALLGSRGYAQFGDQHRVLAAGDTSVIGDATPQHIDYTGGGSAREWPKTLDRVLRLDFERVVPGHGTVASKQDLRRFRDSTTALRTRVTDMLGQKRSRDEVAQMLQSEFKFAEFHLQSLDGLLAELR